MEEISISEKRLYKNQVTQVAQLIQGDAQRILQVLAALDSTNPNVVKNAAWILGHDDALDSQTISTHIDKILFYLNHASHPSVQRCLLRALQKADIPIDKHGTLYGICYDFIINPSTPIAIRAFSMSICARISQPYPELQHELKTILLTQYENGSAGIKSKIKHTIKYLNASKTKKITADEPPF